MYGAITQAIEGILFYQQNGELPAYYSWEPEILDSEDATACTVSDSDSELAGLDYID